MTQKSSAGQIRLPRWAIMALAACAAAVGALAIARLASPGSLASADCACPPDEALRREVAELRGQLEQLRFAVQLSGVTGPVTPAVPGAPPAPATASLASPRVTTEAAGQVAGLAERRAEVTAPPTVPGGRARSYEHFDIPTSAVTIQQSSSGDLVVRNTDPALAGQTIMVRGYTAEPAPYLLQIVVPPAEGR